MKAKLVVEGKEFPIEILDPELEKLIKPKKTGYEKVCPNQYYYYRAADGTAIQCSRGWDVIDDKAYDNADYYSDKTVAENNSRADKLMRQLRRFAVEHRKEKLDWSDDNQYKYTIEFAHDDGTFDIDCWTGIREFGTLYFDSQETAQLAIDTFRDELIWYFTEYKDSL